jgi:uncharacterized protein
MASKSNYVLRLVDPVIDELFEALPALMLVGPRASGKTTTAIRHGQSTLRLDRPEQAGAVRADPDVVLTAFDEPVVIDEWQLVPEVLGAVKRAVDERPEPGRFLLTGSSAADLTAAGWPATGRVVRIPMWGLTQRELVGDATKVPFISRLMRSDLREFRMPSNAPDLRGYVELGLRGGYPELSRIDSSRVRRAWLSSYVDQLVSRDVRSAGVVRDPVKLRRYLQALAANTAGVVDHKTLFDAAEVNRATGIAYDDLLQSLFVTEHVPAWRASRLGQLVGTPKRYLTDAALLAPLSGVDERAVLRSADLLGRVIDTFVVQQLRAELPQCDDSPRLFHLRERHGRREIDLIVETASGDVAAVEIRAGATPDPASARHLAWLRDTIGDRFRVGVVLHSGTVPHQLDDRIFALPICTIWG